MQCMDTREVRSAIRHTPLSTQNTTTGMATQTQTQTQTQSSAPAAVGHAWCNGIYQLRGCDERFNAALRTETTSRVVRVFADCCRSSSGSSLELGFSPSKSSSPRKCAYMTLTALRSSPAPACLSRMPINSSLVRGLEANDNCVDRPSMLQKSFSGVLLHINGFSDCT